MYSFSRKHLSIPLPFTQLGVAKSLRPYLEKIRANPFLALNAPKALLLPTFKCSSAYLVNITMIMGLNNLTNFMAAGVLTMASKNSTLGARLL